MFRYVYRLITLIYWDQNQINNNKRFSLDNKIMFVLILSYNIQQISSALMYDVDRNMSNNDLPPSYDSVINVNYTPVDMGTIGPTNEPSNSHLHDFGPHSQHEPDTEFDRVTLEIIQASNQEQKRSTRLGICAIISIYVILTMMLIIFIYSKCYILAIIFAGIILGILLTGSELCWMIL